MMANGVVAPVIHACCKDLVNKRELIENYAKLLQDTERRKAHEIDQALSYANDADHGVTLSPSSILDSHVHICLHCSFTGALNSLSPMKNGLIKHSFQTDHFLAMHAIRGELYCTNCRDYIYDEDFMRHQIDTRSSSSSSGGYNTTAPRKRKRDITQWEWMLKYRGTAWKNISVGHGPDVQPASNASIIGLRGLYNMGNTCFMSSILQSLLHNPMVRNYFLADMHNTSECENRRKKNQSSSTDYCLACDIDTFFGMMYSLKTGDETENVGDLLNSPPVDSTPHWTSTSAVVPHRLLYSMWQHAHHLAGYEQQDAHEFLMSLLDGIHSHTHCNVNVGGCSPRTGHRGLSLCNCVVHQTFAGVFRSDVTCCNCNSVSSAFDPFFDISLSMDSHGKTTASKLPTTLLSYLDVFTRKEHLTLEERARCEKCESYQDCEKKLSIRTMPNVLCIHFKRFNAVTGKKISTFVEFPGTELDMSPYVSERCATPNHRKNVSHLYDLFAVVNHHGTLTSGHYTNFAKSGKYWFNFDDAYVTRVSESQVLSSEAYLLFYMRRTLSYE